MIFHALIGPGNAIDRIEANIDPKVGTKSGYRWVPVEDTRPQYDPAAQVQSGPVITVEAERVTRVWTVRNKTAEELAADADAQKELALDSADRVLFLIAFDLANQVRALQSKAALTPAQFRAWVKAKL